LRRRAFLIALIAIGIGCAERQAPTALDRLHPCTTDEGPVDAYCGTLAVFENRAAHEGRTIDLKIVLWPALRADAQPDPLFFLAGGPGEGAAKMGRQVREVFRRTQTNRDIVLVDQRGTGDSHPLNCRAEGDSLKTLNEPDRVGLDRLRECLKSYDADPRLYTTSIAMDDLDDVRAYLGYDRINLYGGSYGTRAALVYLRQHEHRVRAVVLDGVAPPDMQLPLFMARDGQRALDKLAADCAADASCAAQYPNLAERTRALLARLQREPAAVRLTHPRTGIAEDVTVDATFVANVVFSALYSPLTSSLVPELIKRAEANDFQGLLALGLTGETAGENMSAGMQLSVICAEDYPRITPEAMTQAAKDTVFGERLLTTRIKACEFWPQGTVPAGYYDPVVSTVPALVLSGDLDPVTPPAWGESVTRHLSNARHFIVPGNGHIALSTGCGARIVRDFIERGNAADLNTSCLKALKRPPFFLSPAGPDPTGQLEQLPGTDREH
jgi:pimeloyl-ACP methyl ester carboxylesterase